MPDRSASAAVILIYHRVADVPCDPQLLCVHPRRFDEQLQVLGEKCHPMSLAALVDALDRGRAPERAVAVTFDDGYADNLTAAKPLLERYDIPATVFVVSGGDVDQGELWWDELERVLLQPGQLPRTLQLALNGQTFAWDLGEAADYGREHYIQHRGWNVLDASAPCSRQALYKELHQRLRPLDSAARRQALATLLDWSGKDSATRPTHRTLSEEELGRLDEGDLVEVGAHTATHPLLAALPAAEQRAEIQRSKRSLETILGRPVTSFSYPYGGRADYSSETVALVRQAGFSRACANFPGSVGPASDPYQLPRVLVRDWSGEEFSRRLDGVFADG